jgi:hypothetical protein
MLGTVGAYTASEVVKADDEKCSLLDCDAVLSNLDVLEEPTASIFRVEEKITSSSGR